MSKLIIDTQDALPYLYSTQKALVYVWNNKNIEELSLRDYLHNRSNYFWKYAYIYDPSYTPWHTIFSDIRHGNVVIFRKNIKKKKQFNSALYLVSKSKIPKEFLTSLMLIGVLK